MEDHLCVVGIAGAKHRALWHTRVHTCVASPPAIHHHTLVPGFKEQRDPMSDVGLDAIEL